MKKNKLNPEIWRDDLPNMDDDMIWANIEKALEDKKPRRFFIYRISAVLLVVILALTYYFLTKQDSIEKNTNHNFIENKVVHVNKKNQESKAYPPAHNSATEDKSPEIKHDKNAVKQQFQKTTTPLSEHSELALYEHNENNSSVKNSYLPSSELNKRNFIKSLIPLKKLDAGSPDYSITQLPVRNIDTTAFFENISIKNDSGRKFIISFSAGTGVPITSTNFDDNSLWQREKAGKEKTLYGYSFQIQLAKPVYKNLFIASGINYSNTVNRLIKKEKTVSVEYFQSDSAYVIKNTNTYLAGKRKKTVTTIKTMTYYNNISHWAIPVDFGYRWKFGKNNITASTGINIRFSSIFTGNTILPGNAVDKYENNKHLIKKHLGISQWHLAIYYSRTISQQLQIFTGTKGAIAIKPDYSIKSSVFSRKYQAIDFLLGVRILL